MNVFLVSVPPLRERRDEIVLLAKHFLQQFAARMAKPGLELSPRAMTRLTAYAWPGNVCELQNVLYRAVILATGPLVEVEEALNLRLDAAPEGFTSDTLEDMERQYILKVLNDTGWLIEGPRGAASQLGLKPSTLRSRILKLKIKRPSAA